MDLRGVRGHLVPRPAVEEADLPDAEPERRPGAVDRGVPSSDHEHPAPDVDLAPQAEVLQELDPGEHAGRVLALDPHLRARPGAEAEEDRAEAVSLQARDCEVPPELRVRAEPHPEAQDLVDLEVENRLRQPVLGDAVSQHPSRLGKRLEDLDLVSPDREEVGAGQPGGARADDGDLPAVRGRQLRLPGVAAPEVEVGDVALDPVDPHRLVEEVPAAALDLAGTGADPAAHRGERVLLLDEPHRVPVLSQGRQGDVPLDVHRRGALELAGSDAVGVVVRQEQLEGRLPGPADLVVVRHHDHARGDLRGAGGEERPRPPYLHDAQEARGERLELAVVAEGGDVRDAVLAGHREDRAVRVRDDPLPVDFELHQSHGFSPSRPRRPGRP